MNTRDNVLCLLMFLDVLYYNVNFIIVLADIAISWTKIYYIFDKYIDFQMYLL